MNTLVKAILWITLLCIAFAAPASAHDLRGYRITDIGGPIGLAINNRGHVTGGPGFLYRNGELEMLDVPGVSVRGMDINDRDQIVGEALETSSGPARVFLWDEGSVQFIGTPDQTVLGLNPLNDRGDSSAMPSTPLPRAISRALSCTAADRSSISGRSPARAAALQPPSTTAA